MLHVACLALRLTHHSTFCKDSTVVPSIEQPETLCINFQYQVVNNQSLSADDIMNEVDNTLKSGLIAATRTTVITILNETYPRSVAVGSFQPPPSIVTKSVSEEEYMGQVMYPGGVRYRKLLQAAEQANAFVMDVDVTLHREEIKDDMANALNIVTRSRHLHYLRDSHSFLRQARRLVYYSDEFPVEITQIVDSNTCPGSIIGDFIMCAVVSSTVCVILEPGDDPVEIRRMIVDGLDEAFRNGDFENNIPSGTRRG